MFDTDVVDDSEIPVRSMRAMVEAAAERIVRSNSIRIEPRLRKISDIIWSRAPQSLTATPDNTAPRVPETLATKWPSFNNRKGLLGAWGTGHAAEMAGRMVDESPGL